MKHIKKFWKEFQRTDKWQMRVIQWPFALVFYVVFAPVAFFLCIGVGLLWPILGKDT